MKISDELRRIVAESEMTNYELWKLTGVQQSAISRLMAGKHTSTATLDRLQSVLGLHLVADADEATKGRKQAEKKRNARKGAEG